MPVCSRQLLHPPIPIDLDTGSAALEYLVGVEAGNDHHGRELEHEGRQKGHGDHDAPDADKIVDHHEFRITAAADDPRGHRHLVGGAKARHAKDENEIQGHLAGFGGDIGRDGRVQVDNGHAEKEQEGGGTHANPHEHELEGLGVGLDDVHSAAPYRFSNQDRRR